MIVNKNDEIIIDIEDMGSDGEGIGKYQGYTIFVKNALVGDRIKTKLMKTKKSYGYGRLIEIIEPSPYRVTPKCPIADKCGGCSIQHLDYKRQLEYKQNKVKNCLERIGGFPVDTFSQENIMEPIIGMEEPFYYRNKAQFPVGINKDGKVVIGFYAGRTHSIIDTSHCYIQATVNDEILQRVRQFLEEYHISVYNEEKHEGLVRHILTRVGFTTEEIMVCLIVNGNELPHKEQLIESLCQIPHMTSISLNINREKTNVILGDTIKTLWGKPYITDYIGDIKYQISPLSFYQVNPIQTRVLYETALEYAGLTGEETVWDLYCGIGTISLFLAQKAKQVYGVEIVPQAIEDARKNAEINHITNAEFYVGAAEEILPKKYKEDSVYGDVIVVDPPRKGCEESLLDTILAMAPKRIVYVSCDPATLARDLKYLCDKEYQISKIQVVDQFGHSIHVESVVLLSHKRADSFINVKMEYDDDIYRAPDRVTYKLIQEYIEDKYNFKVHTAYIAEVKRSLGLPMYDAPNAVEELKYPYKPAPEFKVEAIKDALRHFNVI